MKHYATPLIALLLALCTFISCSKPIEESPVEEKSHVTVNVSPFSLSMEEMGATRAALKDAATRLSFAVFDTKGEIVFSVQQNSEEANFGKVRMELSPGTYRVVAIAHNGEGDAEIKTLYSVTLPGACFTDTFTKVEDLTVETGKDCTLTMTLPRVTSAFILRISDEAPEGTKEIEVVVNFGGLVPTSLEIDPSLGLAMNNWGQTCIIPVSKISSDVPIYFIGMYQIPTWFVNIKATAYDEEGKELISHKLQSVPLKANETTTATGNFFTPKVSGTFTVSDWGADNKFPY